MDVKILVIVYGCLSANLGNAANLVDAVNAARSFDTDMAAAREGQQAGHEKRWQGIAGFLPSAQLDGGYNKNSQPGMPYGEYVQKHNWSATITQPLFDASKLANYQRGNALSDSADVDYQKAGQQLIVDVSDAYFDALYEREVLQAAQAAKKAFRNALDEATAALEVGNGTRTEVDEAQANLDQAQAHEISAQNDLKVARIAYRRLTGLSAEDIVRIQWSCMPAALPMNLANSVEQASLANLNVRSAQLQLDQSDADVVSADSVNLPVVNLQASYGKNWSVGSGENLLDSIFGTTSKSNASVIGVTVTIPLFAGGGQLSQVREARYRRKAATDLLESARRKARQDVSENYLGVTNGLALIHARERALASAENKVKSTQYGREVGLRNSIDELNAQQRYFESIRDLANSRYEYLKTRLKLFATLGVLNDTELDEIDCQPGR